MPGPEWRDSSFGILGFHFELRGATRAGCRASGANAEAEAASVAPLLFVLIVVVVLVVEVVEHYPHVRSDISVLIHYSARNEVAVGVDGVEVWFRLDSFFRIG